MCCIRCVHKGMAGSMSPKWFFNSLSSCCCMGIRSSFMCAHSVDLGRRVSDTLRAGTGKKDIWLGVALSLIFPGIVPCIACLQCLTELLNQTSVGDILRSADVWLATPFTDLPSTWRQRVYHCERANILECQLCWIGGPIVMWCFIMGLFKWVGQGPASVLLSEQKKRISGCVGPSASTSATLSSYWSDYLGEGQGSPQGDTASWVK